LRLINRFLFCNGEEFFVLRVLKSVLCVFRAISGTFGALFPSLKSQQNEFIGVHLIYLVLLAGILSEGRIKIKFATGGENDIAIE
jgi:hypothetical protein